MFLCGTERTNPTLSHYNQRGVSKCPLAVRRKLNPLAAYSTRHVVSRRVGFHRISWLVKGHLLYAVVLHPRKDFPVTHLPPSSPPTPLAVTSLLLSIRPLAGIVAPRARPPLSPMPPPLTARLDRPRLPWEKLLPAIAPRGVSVSKGGSFLAFQAAAAARRNESPASSSSFLAAR